LAVNLACVDFVEERHENERVEDDGEMLRRGRAYCGRVVIASAVNVKHHVT